MSSHFGWEGLKSLAWNILNYNRSLVRIYVVFIICNNILKPCVRFSKPVQRNYIKYILFSRYILPFKNGNKLPDSLSLNISLMSGENWFLSWWTLIFCNLAAFSTLNLIIWAYNCLAYIKPFWCFRPTRRFCSWYSLKLPDLTAKGNSWRFFLGLKTDCAMKLLRTVWQCISSKALSKALSCFQLWNCSLHFWFVTD